MHPKSVRRVAALVGCVLVATAASASAADGGFAVLGQDNVSSAQTSFAALGNAIEGFGGLNGVEGTTTNQIASGVYGENNALDGGYGVAGRANHQDGVGVYGDAVGPAPGSGTGVLGVGGVLGVQGQTWSSVTGAAGVEGEANNSLGGVGVLARAVGSGTGLLSSAPNGTAISATGKTHFNRSGTVTIPAGQKSAQVTVPGGVSTSTLAIATIQTQLAGLAVSSASPDPASGTITITLTKAVPAGKTATLAYIALD
jgi:hypothetical protein